VRAIEPAILGESGGRYFCRLQRLKAACIVIIDKIQGSSNSNLKNHLEQWCAASSFSRWIKYSRRLWAREEPRGIRGLVSGNQHIYYRRGREMSL
jgi:hypothetical protein